MDPKGVILRYKYLIFNVQNSIGYTINAGSKAIANPNWELYFESSFFNWRATIY